MIKGLEDKLSSSGLSAMGINGAEWGPRADLGELRASGCRAGPAVCSITDLIKEPSRATRIRIY